jgi:type IV pilus assembly protein PilB
MPDVVAERLCQANLITKEALAQAERQEKVSGTPVIGTLLRSGAITEAQLTEFLSQFYNVPAVDLNNISIEPEVIALIPAEVASRYLVVPLHLTGRKLTVATANPSNIFAIDDIKFITGYDVEPVVCCEPSIRKAIDRYYDAADSLATVMKDMSEDLEIVEEQTLEETAQLDEADQAPVVKFVNSLLKDAVRRGASDIHVECYEKAVRVRFRMDGMLHEMTSPPSRLKAGIISRLKIMAELDIAERRVPQDGRIKVRVLGKTIDLRVSTLPTIFGEKIVMRILDKSNLNIDLSKLGFQTSALDHFHKAIESPYGMVLVTGPTGSGKTTTLYSALSKVNVPDVNIMTAEDPVEYNLDGINQVPINEDVGLTFSAALRAFLRQDPNIVMVGEIRDIDTASIAVKAALTGHLVLSTLHTNDAPSTLNRLMDMGLQPFLVASSLNLVLAQRLIRKVCKHCKREVELHPEILEELQIDAESVSDTRFYKGEGCFECNNTGYQGRAGLYEVMPITATLREMILNRCHTSEIKQKAIEDGMITLRQDGILKLKSGITTAEEVLKETAPD